MSLLAVQVLIGRMWSIIRNKLSFMNVCQCYSYYCAHNMPPYASGFSYKRKRAVAPYRRRTVRRRVSMPLGGRKFFRRGSRFVRSPAYIRSSAKPEMKWVDGFNNTVVDGNTIQMNQLNAAPQYYAANLVGAGSSSFQRVGDHIKGNYLRLNGQVYPDQEKAQTETEYLKIAVIYDRNPNANGSFPAISDIYQCVSPIGQVDTTVFSPPNITNKDRFTILKEQTFTKPYKSTASTGHIAAESSIQYDSVNLINWYINMKGCDTNFSTTNTPPVLGDCRNGAVYILGLGSSEDVADSAFNFAFQCRYTYYDV